jgi:hypothetical protein
MIDEWAVRADASIVMAKNSTDDVILTGET